MVSMLALEVCQRPLAGFDGLPSEPLSVRGAPSVGGSFQGFQMGAGPVGGAAPQGMAMRGAGAVSSSSSGGGGGNAAASQSPYSERASRSKERLEKKRQGREDFIRNQGKRGGGGGASGGGGGGSWMTRRGAAERAASGGGPVIIGAPQVQGSGGLGSGTGGGGAVDLSSAYTQQKASAPDRSLEEKKKRYQMLVQSGDITQAEYDKWLAGATGAQKR